MSQALVGGAPAGHMKPRLPKLMITGVKMFFSLRIKNGIKYYAKHTTNRDNIWHFSGRHARRQQAKQYCIGNHHLHNFGI